MTATFQLPDHVREVTFGDGCGKSHKPDKNGKVQCDDCAAVAGNYTFHAPGESVLPDAHLQVIPQAPVTADAPAATNVIEEPGPTTVEELEAKHAARQANAMGAKAVAPAVRAHADELGVDLATVQGSGKNGAITKADVTAAAEAATAGEAVTA